MKHSGHIAFCANLCKKYEIKNKKHKHLSKEKSLQISSRWYYRSDLRKCVWNTFFSVHWPVSTYQCPLVCQQAVLHWGWLLKSQMVCKLHLCSGAWSADFLFHSHLCCSVSKLKATIKVLWITAINFMAVLNFASVLDLWNVLLSFLICWKIIRKKWVTLKSLWRFPPGWLDYKNDRGLFSRT